MTHDNSQEEGLMMDLQVSIEINGKQNRVGTIHGDGRRNGSFSYDRAYLERPEAVPISVALPLREEPFSVVRTHYFFDGLLPEGFTRRSVAWWARAAEDDYLSILAALGKECIGAVQILPEDASPLSPSYEKMTLDQVRALAREGASKSAEIVTQTHLSLTGASGKVGLYQKEKDDSWYLPGGNAPSTHILKQSHIRFRHIITNEQLALLTAQKLGLETTESFIVNTGAGQDDEVLFAARRFDRTFPEDPVTVDGLAVPFRLHQEDFAQALAIPAADKYELEGANHLRDMFALLRRVSSNPVEDQLKLWNILIFDVLIGNTDNHLKNYSLLYSPDLKGIRLAPAYDIVSTAVYDQSTREMAFRIGDARMLTDVTRTSFSLASSEAGLGTALALRHFDRMAEYFPKALEEATAQLVSAGYPEAELLRTKILQRGGCSKIV